MDYADSHSFNARSILQKKINEHKPQNKEILITLETSLKQGYLMKIIYY